MIKTVESVGATLAARARTLQDRRSADHFFKHRSLTEFFTERDVLFSYFLFRPFAIFDVSSCSVPSCYLPLFIFERSSADTETTETRRPASAIELRIHGASPQEIASFFHKGMLSIFRVNEFIEHPAWLAPLLQSDAAIFERCVIAVESASIRSQLQRCAAASDPESVEALFLVRGFFLPLACSS